MNTLFMKDNNGAIRVWQIFPTDTGLEIRHGIEGGSFQVKTENVPRGKVNRTIEEQIELRIQSRINKQIDRGYSFSREDALKRPTNSLGLIKPMLAQKYRDVQVDFKRGIYIQRKYDGNRCIIHNRNGEIIAYSRNGKLITSISHILSTIEMPVGHSIDGELYVHGRTLQEIVSFVKREQAESLSLKFHAYDYVCDESFDLRYDRLICVKGNIELAPTYFIHSEVEMLDYHQQFRDEGYEGTMIRLHGTRYEDGKRSKHLLKVKELQDDEFLVIDVSPSKDNFGILHCVMPSGKYFKVTAPGTHFDKQFVLTNKEYYIGKRVTVEYAYLTEDGIPFHPVAKVWR